MYAPLANILDHTTDDEFNFCVQVLPAWGHMPAVLQHSEAFVPRTRPFLDIVRMLEHDRCASARLEGILAVVRESAPQNCLTARPGHLGPPSDPPPLEPPADDKPGAATEEATLSIVEDPGTAIPGGAAAASSSDVLAPITSIEAVEMVDKIFQRQPGDEDSIPSPTSVVMSEINETPADALPIPEPFHLDDSEREILTGLAHRIHARIAAARSDYTDELYMLANWYTTLRYLATEIPMLSPPPGLPHCPVSSVPPGDCIPLVSSAETESED